ncbi:MAG: hypothetical protein KA792_01005 [Bacteroidales bacterium]|nr:hypothetical protein [Bacteroidales bacterium]
MAKFLNSIYSPNKSGRLGASVFGKNAFGPFEKMLGIPSNPRTIGQMNRRNQFAALARRWGNLTEGQRTKWDNLAKDYPIVRKGMSHYLSGFLFFLMLNSNLQIIGESIVEDSHRLDAPQAFESFSVDVVCTPGSEDMNMNVSPAISSGSKIQVYASKVLKPGRKAQAKEMRLITVLDHSFISGNSIKDAYIAKFGGMPSTGEKAAFWIKATNITDGYTSLPYTCVSFGIA